MPPINVSPIEAAFPEMEVFQRAFSRAAELMHKELYPDGDWANLDQPTKLKWIDVARIGVSEGYRISGIDRDMRASVETAIGAIDYGTTVLRKAMSQNILRNDMLSARKWEPSDDALTKVKSVMESAPSKLQS